MIACRGINLSIGLQKLINSFIKCFGLLINVQLFEVKHGFWVSVSVRVGIERKTECFANRSRSSLSLCFCTPSRTRTGMSVKTMVFETIASTNSAIGASQERPQSYANFSGFPNQAGLAPAIFRCTFIIWAYNTNSYFSSRNPLLHSSVFFAINYPANFAPHFFYGSTVEF